MCHLKLLTMVHTTIATITIIRIASSTLIRDSTTTTSHLRHSVCTHVSCMWLLRLINTMEPTHRIHTQHLAMYSVHIINFRVRCRFTETMRQNPNKDKLRCNENSSNLERNSCQGRPCALSNISKMFQPLYRCIHARSVLVIF